MKPEISAAAILSGSDDAPIPASKELSTLNRVILRLELPALMARMILGLDMMLLLGLSRFKQVFRNQTRPSMLSCAEFVWWDSRSKQTMSSSITSSQGESRRFFTLTMAVT